MPRFFFPIDYDGSRYSDEQGEVFATNDEAETYAATVASELGNNNHKPVVVFLVTGEGVELARITAGNGAAARKIPVPDADR